MQNPRLLVRLAPALGLLALVNGAALFSSSCSCSADATTENIGTGDSTGGRAGTGTTSASQGAGGGGGTTSSAAGGGEASTTASGPSPEDAGLPDSLPDFTDAELAPTTAIDGIPAPLDGVYTDLGAADPTASFRALIGFPIRQDNLLDESIKDIYDPASASFRDYFTRDEWMAAFAPYPIDVHLVKLWIESRGMRVNFTASNRLLFQFTGTVAQFNEAFGTELRLFERENPLSNNPPIDVFGTLGALTVPTWVSDRISGIVTCDLAADTSPLPGEAGSIVEAPPANVDQGRTLAQIAHAYDIDDLYDLGWRGQGVQLGVAVGAGFKFKDLQSFWRSLGVTRPDPRVVVTMEPISTRYLEATLDVEWAGGIAPGADLVVYQGPDSRNTSMLYTFNEAIGQGEISVLTDSFAHREDSEPSAVRRKYHHAAKMAAALGITVIAATGDSSQPDIPATSPYVTGAGGTVLTLAPDGSVANEVAWPGSGSGASLTFGAPWWQTGVLPDPGAMRGVADVALNASAESPYWVYYLGNWQAWDGTSFSSPTFAGLIAVVNSYRAGNGKPQAGFLNSLLYQTPSVQAAFRDIVTGATYARAAGPGWDYPTGWGAPRALDLAVALP